jgi:hypothetical protein
MGEWTPVFKKGNRQQDTNYRFIASLIAVCKIVEQVLCKKNMGKNIMGREGEKILCKQIADHYDQTLYHRITAYRKITAVRQPC